MEIVQIYSVYDVKGQKHDVPFFAYNDLFAKRRFILMVREKGSILNNFKDDFSLMCLGNINVITGEIVSDIKIVVEGKNIEKEEVINEISNEA